MTRQGRKISEKKSRNRVDNGSPDALRSRPEPLEDGQGSREGGVKINDDVWAEFILVAKYLHSKNNEAEIADVFEFFRLHDLGGDPISPSLWKRVTREVETECGPF